MDGLLGFNKASKYAYSVATIRFYETKLLTREKILRMMGADSVSECFRMLEEAGYAVALGSPTDFTPIIQREYMKALSLLRELSMDERVYELFAIRHDFHNLKVAVKENLTAEDQPKAYQVDGIFPQRDIKASVFDDDFGRLGDAGSALAEAYADIKKHYEESASPKIIDIVADRHMYRDILRRGDSINNSFLKRIFVKEIDLINIRTFFRLRYLNKHRMDFTEAYIEGGDFHIDFFLKNYEDDFYTLKSIFKGTEFLNLITDGSAYIEEHGSFLRFERLTSEYFMKYVKGAKWVSFGVEPIVAYFFAKEKELKAVKIILTGKLNGLSNDDIKEVIPDEYI